MCLKKRKFWPIRYYSKIRKKYTSCQLNSLILLCVYNLHRCANFWAKVSTIVLIVHTRNKMCWLLKLCQSFVCISPKAHLSEKLINWYFKVHFGKYASLSQIWILLYIRIFCANFWDEKSACANFYAFCKSDWFYK